MKTATKIASLAWLVVLATVQPAFAYIDPTAGTFILQILAAAALGFAFYFRRFLSFVKRLFGIAPASKSPDAEESSK